jgi:response regulator of citrate/malate metabolism
VISVLVVEDEPVAAAAHQAYVERVAGFTVSGVAHTGQAALRLLQTSPVDLVLLDLRLPDMNGLDLCRRMRAARIRSDVIAVTSVRDLSAVHSAVSLGIVQYVLKPFTYRSLADKLERYADYHAAVGQPRAAAAQSEVDEVISRLRGADPSTAPPGLAAETLRGVTAALHEAPGGMSASEVAGICGISRVTARRYLEHLAQSGAVRRTARYGGGGRPEIEYAMHSPSARH